MTHNTAYKNKESKTPATAESQNLWCVKPFRIIRIEESHTLSASRIHNVFVKKPNAVCKKNTHPAYAQSVGRRS